MMQTPLIINCVLNSFLSYTTITLNTLTILALRRTSHLSKTLKMLLLNLAVTDLGVGLLAQPSYVVYLVMIIQGKTQTFTSEITLQIVYITGKFLSYVSFFGVVALAADRFLSIYLHLRYQELVTYKRVLAVVVSIWILSAILALIFSLRPQIEFFYFSTYGNRLLFSYSFVLFKDISPCTSPQNSNTHPANTGNSGTD